MAVCEEDTAFDDIVEEEKKLAKNTARVLTYEGDFHLDVPVDGFHDPNST